MIIGGVAGGAGAAARLRRLAEDTEITVFERGQYISFAIRVRPDTQLAKDAGLPFKQATCGIGLHGYLAERVLHHSGCTNVVNLTGGYFTYRAVMAEKKLLMQ